jgi:hypothetical protein
VLSCLQSHGEAVDLGFRITRTAAALSGAGRLPEIVASHGVDLGDPRFLWGCYWLYVDLASHLRELWVSAPGRQRVALARRTHPRFNGLVDLIPRLLKRSLMAVLHLLTHGPRGPRRQKFEHKE